MKRWEIITKLKINSALQNEKLKIHDVIKVLLINHGIKTKKEIEEFLNPKLKDVTTKSVGIDNKQLKKTIERIQKAIKDKEKIVIFGDYDVDGICGTAILWETLNCLEANVLPYIPHRIDEGYGLSIKGIQNVILNSFQDLKGMPKLIRQAQNLSDNRRQVRHDIKKGLIITVDNGIVANKAVKFANEQGIDIIITDHHIPSNPSTGSGLPKAFAIVHTTKLCGAGVAWLLSNVILNSFQDLNRKKMPNQAQPDQHDNLNKDHLELVALATVADLVPLVGANRTLVKFGIEKLRKTKRVGLLELYKEAAIQSEDIGVYEVGHIIAPRLNAMGRLDYAMDSLRLLCTTNQERARLLAQKLGSTNRERQELTIETVKHAKSIVQSSKFKVQSLLFVSDESYQQGVIGLVAGKLVEEFYRPSIVVSVGEKYSKASARSINGFNMIEFIRGASELLVDAGGHPMAAGFTVETAKLKLLQKTLEDKAVELLNEEKLTRTLRIDCELDLSFINDNLYTEIQKLSPFGMGNPEPTFVSRRVVVEDMRLVGNGGKHIKFVFSCHPEFISGSRLVEIPNQSMKQVQDMVRNDKSNKIDGIAFGMGERASEFHIGDKVDIVYTISEDRWNGNKKLQLKIKDIK